LTSDKGGILGRPLKVINVGLPDFASDLAAAGVPVVDVEWRPPAGGDARLLELLSLLDGPPQRRRVTAGETHFVSEKSGKHARRQPAGRAGRRPSAS
jgi:hypothetical protein